MSGCLRTVLLLLAVLPVAVSAQSLRLQDRKQKLPGGTAFATLLLTSGDDLPARERLVFEAVKAGNIPHRKLIPIRDSAVIEGKMNRILYFVSSDYLAIGSETDYFYMPLTAALAQRIANRLHCSLPTRKMVDAIYSAAPVKMEPQPIPPSAAMTTVAVFAQHNDSLKAQREARFPGTGNLLVAGNKKDVVISNRIIADNGSSRVVIYGWHKPGGTPIQPLYNGHKPDWADYSHGIRLVQNKVWVNGRKTTLQKVLQSEKLNVLLSDEGPLYRLKYPLYRSPSSSK